MPTHVGELAALATAVLWTVSAVIYEGLTRRVGSMAINLIRLVMAFFMLSVSCLLTRGRFWPTDAGRDAWIWLLGSGIAGFVLGDFLLFRAFNQIGARRSMLIQALVPPFTGILGFAFLHERLALRHTLAMVVTLAGIVLVMWRGKGEPNDALGCERRRVTSKGVRYALGAAAGQSLGLVMSKIGMGSYDPFAAAQIRVLAGALGFAVLFAAFNRWAALGPALKSAGDLARLSLGAFLGTFLGISLSLLAIQNTLTGVAATLMALVPVLIIAPSAIVNRERITVNDVAGALLAVSGTALFFL